MSDVPAPEVGTEVELEVGPVAHGGHCVARLDGRVVFVRHTLPGERVRARVTEGGPSFWRADAVEVLQASPDRVEPAWPAAGVRTAWAAASSRTSRSPAQRRWKTDVLDRAAAAPGPHRPGVAGPRGHRRGRARRRRAPRPALPHPDRPGGRRRRARRHAQAPLARRRGAEEDAARHRGDRRVRRRRGRVHAQLAARRPADPGGAVRGRAGPAGRRRAVAPRQARHPAQRPTLRDRVRGRAVGYAPLPRGGRRVLAGAPRGAVRADPGRAGRVRRDGGRPRRGHRPRPVLRRRAVHVAARGGRRAGGPGRRRRG